MERTAGKPYSKPSLLRRISLKIRRQARKGKTLTVAQREERLRGSAVRSHCRCASWGWGGGELSLLRRQKKKSGHHPMYSIYVPDPTPLWHAHTLTQSKVVHLNSDIIYPTVSYLLHVFHSRLKA